MLRCSLRILSVVTLLVTVPARAPGQVPTSASSAVVAEVREAVRRYDDALRRADVAAVEKFFAPEYTFVNARGERLTRADRLTNLRTGRTTVDSLAHAPEEEQIRSYGNVVVYTTLLTLGGQYSGQSQRGQYRALVVWVRREGRWQQVASQLTPVASP
ncbi:MAG TPA: nuclear transport factor 2 family protein [Gemmatimonadaceae bacterium]|nr:nuclear transport factor 2 family protein [Gemmatimonadaceae bacterium]